MKYKLSFLLGLSIALILSIVSIKAQPTNTFVNGMIHVGTSPTGMCSSGIYIHRTTGAIYNCPSSTHTWTLIGGSVTVPGMDTQILFNDGGALGADVGLTFNKTTHLLGVAGDVNIRTVDTNNAIITLSPGPANRPNIQLGEPSSNSVYVAGFDNLEVGFDFGTRITGGGVGLFGRGNSSSSAFSNGTLLFGGALTETTANQTWFGDAVHPVFLIGTPDIEVQSPLKLTGSYLNFSTTSGTSGYGLRDNAGTIEVKNSGGSWSSIGGGLPAGLSYASNILSLGIASSPTADQIITPIASTSGNEATIFLRGQTSTSADGGGVILRGGEGATTGGSIQIVAGTGTAGNANGGTISLVAGDKSGTGTAGYLWFRSHVYAELGVDVVGDLYIFDPDILKSAFLNLNATASQLNLNLAAGGVTNGLVVDAPIIATKFIGSGTAPSVSNTSAASCGTTTATIVGTDSAGKVTVGATSGTSCTVTFGTAWTNAPACSLTNESTANLARATSTTTTVILAGVFAAGDVLAYSCIGY